MKHQTSGSALASGKAVAFLLGAWFLYQGKLPGAILMALIFGLLSIFED